jgi:hypothetical protein
MPAADIWGRYVILVEHAENAGGGDAQQPALHRRHSIISSQCKRPSASPATRRLPERKAKQ